MKMNMEKEKTIQGINKYYNIILIMILKLHWYKLNDTGGLTCSSVIPHLSQAVVTHAWDTFLSLRTHSGLPRCRAISGMLMKASRLMKTDIYPRLHSTAIYEIKWPWSFDVVCASIVVVMFAGIVVSLLVVEVEDTVVLVVLWTWAVLTVLLIDRFPNVVFVIDVVVSVTVEFEDTPG